MKTPKPNRESPQKHPIHIKLFTPDYERLVALANAEHRSITNYVLVLILRHLHESAKHPPTA